MLRRSLFWGLTLVLIVALSFLIVRGCRLEKEQARQLVETIEEAKPTFTRVLEPHDLKIVRLKTDLGTNADGKEPSKTARHEIEIFNGGNVPYREILLKFVYASRSGKELETRTHAVIQTIFPGATLKLTDIKIDDISPSAATSQATIICADIESSAPPKQ